MRRPFVYSLILHLLVITFAIVGLPSLQQPPAFQDEPVSVELTTVAERANPPSVVRPAPVAEPQKPAEAPPPEPTPKPEPKAEPRPASTRPEPPKPEPKTEPRPAPTRREPPKPEPQREKAEPKPEPKAVADAASKPEPKAELRAHAKPKPPVRQEAEVPGPETKPIAPPERKPEPPEPAESRPKAPQPPKPPEVPKAEAQNQESARKEQKPETASDFASVLKTVDELKQQSAKAERKPAKPMPVPPSAQAGNDESQSDFTSEVAHALRSSGPIGNKPSPVTSSEIDAVRRQIERCWNLPGGGKDSGNLVVSIRVEMNVDGTPRSAVVMNAGQMQGNPYYQAVADSARRAVLNPRCHPFKLPPEKYDHWRAMTLIFNPKEMS